MRYNGWKQVIEEDDWLIMSDPYYPTNLIAICKKHRMSQCCAHCGWQPKKIKKKLTFLRKLMSYAK